MSLTKHKFFKNFVALVVLTLVMFVLAGCQKDDKIELTLEKDQYQVTVGEEITVHPGVTKGKDVKEVKLVYSSDDESIATYVDGKIKGIAVGETKVKVAVDGRENVYKEFTVKVVAKPTFTITYNLNGGINSGQNPTTFTEDDLPITLGTPNRVEYEFKGWYLTSNFAGNPVTQITEAEDIVLYAKWEEVKYQITYELDGGTLPEGAITAFAKSELNVTLPTPTKDGFRFDGWYLTNTFEGDAVTTITKAEAITVYAKWTQLYKITYELDGGTLADALVAFAEDQLPITLKTPTKEGFKFLGWFLAEDFSGEAVTQITEAKDVTLYAKWEEEVAYSTVQEARDAEVNAVLTVRGIVTGKNGNNAFLQDETAGIYIYLGNNSNFNDKLVVGNEIAITAKRAVFNQLVQLSNPTEIVVLDTNVELPDIVELETLDLDEILEIQSQRLSLKEVEIVSVPTNISGPFNIGIRVNDVTIDIRIESVVDGYNEIKEFFEQVIIGQKANLVGVFAGRFHENAQLALTDLSQIKLLPLTKELVESLLQEQLKPVQNVTSDLILETTVTLAGVTYQITWESNKPEVITADGAVTRPAIGEDDVVVVLTAKTTFGEEEITLTFEVTVLAQKEAGTLPKEILAIDFSDLSNKESYLTWLGYEKYTGFSAIGNMGQAYGGYAGFGRSGSDISSLLTREIMVDREFDITLEVKGNTIKDNVFFTVEAVDANGEVIATAKVLSDSGNASTIGDTIGRLINNDSTVVLEFTTDTLVGGRTFEDIVKVKITYDKSGGSGNMGLKSINIEHKE